MRFGLIRDLNARPLDYGFRKSGSYDLIDDTPSGLLNRMMRGELDAALLSSVECLRNSSRLGFSLSVGVCAETHVGSILFISDRRDKTPGTVLADRGSRTSVALLDLLYLRTFGKRPMLIPEDPLLIPDRIKPGTGGLLIGDAALRYRYGHDPERVEVLDLVEWWRNLEGLPFVFALWAYPIEKPLPDSLFIESLDYGLAHLEEILESSAIPYAREYLSETLHYRLTEMDRRAIERFRALLAESGLLSV
jgi:chorismate dehydratase